MTFKGKIIVDQTGQKLIKVEDDSNSKKLFETSEEFKLSQEDSFVYDLNEGDEVFFNLNKKIYADKTDLVAKIQRVNNQDWNKIFRDFIFKTNNHSISKYQEYLETNYSVPQPKTN
jgi:hypothetical protein